MNVKIGAAFVLAFGLLAIGGAHAQSKKKADAALEPLAAGKIRLTPVDLFPAELKRLEPHLEISGVCYKVEYNGPEVFVNLVVEEWKDGKREGYFSSGMQLSGPLAGEVSVSIKPTLDDDGHRASRVITSVQQARGSSSTTGMNFPKPQLKESFSYKRMIKQPTDFNSDAEIGIWSVLTVKAGVPTDETKSIGELSKEVDYAIVWKLVPRGNE